MELKLSPKKWHEFEEWKKSLDEDGKLQVAAIIKQFDETIQQIENKNEDEEDVKYREMLRIFYARYHSLPFENFICALFSSFADGWVKGVETTLMLLNSPEEENK